MSEQKLAYMYDSAGFYTGSTEATASPLESGVYLLPANATLQEPPEATEGKQARWNGTSWSLVATQIGSEEVAITKLKEFLANNPDVAALLNK